VRDIVVLAVGVVEVVVNVRKGRYNLLFRQRRLTEGKESNREKRRQEKKVIS